MQTDCHVGGQAAAGPIRVGEKDNMTAAQDCGVLRLPAQVSAAEVGHRHHAFEHESINILFTPRRPKDGLAGLHLTLLRTTRSTPTVSSPRLTGTSCSTRRRLECPRNGLRSLVSRSTHRMGRFRSSRLACCLFGEPGFAPGAETKGVHLLIIAVDKELPPLQLDRIVIHRIRICRAPPARWVE